MSPSGRNDPKILAGLEAAADADGKTQQQRHDVGRRPAAGETRARRSSLRADGSRRSTRCGRIVMSDAGFRPAEQHGRVRRRPFPRADRDRCRRAAAPRTSCRRPCGRNRGARGRRAPPHREPFRPLRLGTGCRCGRSRRRGHSGTASSVSMRELSQTTMRSRSFGLSPST